MLQLYKKIKKQVLKLGFKIFILCSSLKKSNTDFFGVSIFNCNKTK